MREVVEAVEVQSGAPFPSRFSEAPTTPTPPRSCAVPTPNGTWSHHGWVRSIGSAVPAREGARGSRTVRTSQLSWCKYNTPHPPAARAREHRVQGIEGVTAAYDVRGAGPFRAFVDDLHATPFRIVALLSQSARVLGRFNERPKLHRQEVVELLRRQVMSSRLPACVDRYVASRPRMLGRCGTARCSNAMCSLQSVGPDRRGTPNLLPLDRCWDPPSSLIASSQSLPIANRCASRSAHSLLLATFGHRQPLPDLAERRPHPLELCIG